MWETTKRGVYGDRRGEVEPTAPRPRPRLPDPAPGCEHGCHDRARPQPGPPAPRRRVSARIGGIAESATLAVDAKAKALKAEGRPVIGFGAGEPDFPTPDYIVEAAVEACRDPRTTATPRPAGCPSSRRRSPRRRCATAGTTSSPAQVLVTNGGKQAIYEAFATMLDPGDEVIAPGAVLDDVPRGDPARRRRAGRGARRRDPGLQGHRRAARGGAHRPHQGAAVRARRRTRPARSTPPTRSGRSAAWVEDHELWVLTDEIYEHLVYDGVETGSLPVLCP